MRAHNINFQLLLSLLDELEKEKRKWIYIT